MCPRKVVGSKSIQKPSREEVRYGLQVTLECTGFACFRRPTSTSTILTYPIPPFTTLLGLVACAKGLANDRIDPQNHDLLAQQLQIGIAPLRIGVRNRELASLLKLKSILTDTKTKVQKLKKNRQKFVQEHTQRYSDEAISRFEEFIEATGGIPWQTWSRSPSSPIFREFLFVPAYRIYFVGMKSVVDEIWNALRDPRRPLYLGKSDDMVALILGKPTPVTQRKTHIFHSVIPGIHPNCEAFRIPLRFINNRQNLRYTTVSIPAELPIEVQEEILGYDFQVDGKTHTVAVFPYEQNT
jgi:CRISPR-associated protein Cas5h